ncbi:MAG: BtrH N-terminal domain-containing protein, partial [Thermodesulfobacteriota bacterium]
GAALVNHLGINLSEPMAFGMGGGLFFGYFPFIRLNSLPLTTYRSATGNIIKRLTRNLNLTITHHSFRRPEAAMDKLDDYLAEGIPVGLQTSVFWLPYFPKAYRFHFNGHNLVVYGKQGNDYLISDPVFPMTVTCPREDLIRARFAPGALAPKGKMYVLAGGAQAPDFEAAVIDGIRYSMGYMVSKPFFLIGVRGIRFLASRLQKWPTRLGRENAEQHLGHVVRMQEEIGTGGGGFRFLFADFLRESAEFLKLPELTGCAASFTETGDRWRDFAVMAARICKGRPAPDDNYKALSEIMLDCADREEEASGKLLQIVKEF